MYPYNLKRVKVVDAICGCPFNFFCHNLNFHRIGYVPTRSRFELRPSRRISAYCDAPKRLVSIIQRTVYR